MEDEFIRIGADLMEYASEEASFSASRGVVTELFPYIFAASRTMSSRAISRWLEERQGIKLSAVTIAKALREPRKHWIAFTDKLEASVRIYAEAFEVKPEIFLRSFDSFDHTAATPAKISAGTAEEAEISMDEVHGAVQKIRDEWFSLPDTARKQCIDFLLIDAPADDETGEEKSE